MTAIAEMKHAEAIAERLNYLGGIPTTKPTPIFIGTTLKQNARDRQEGRGGGDHDVQEDPSRRSEGGDETRVPLQQDPLGRGGAPRPLHLPPREGLRSRSRTRRIVTERPVSLRGNAVFSTVPARSDCRGGEPSSPVRIQQGRSGGLTDAVHEDGRWDSGSRRRGMCLPLRPSFLRAQGSLKGTELSPPRPGKRSRNGPGTPGSFLLDVRTPKEFNEERIEGAVMVDLSFPSFRDEMSKIRPAEDVPCLLPDGNRTRVPSVLRESGVQERIRAFGRITKWKEAGFPTAAIQPMAHSPVK